MFRRAFLPLLVLLAACTSSPLAPLKGLHGVVTDAAGNQLEGAIVSFYAPYASLAGPAPIIHQTVTDRLGRYSYEGAQVATYNILVSKGSLIGAALDVHHQSVTGAAAPVKVPTGNAGRISGTVTLSDSASAEGALVFVSGTSLMTVADRDGKYTITNVPATPQGATYRVVAMLALYARGVQESVAVASGSQATANFALTRLDLNTAFGKITTVADADWMPVTMDNFEDMYGYSDTPDTSSGYGYLFHDINEPAITEDVIHHGAVLVYLQPNLNSYFGLYWEMLPFSFEFIYNDANVSFRAVDTFTFRVGVGKLRLYHLRLTTSGAFVSKSSYTLPERDFKYTVITAGTLSAMRSAGVDTSNPTQMLRYLSIDKQKF